MKIDCCLHTHTSRCGHAAGQDEDYVLAALKAGFSVLGFSDHVILPGIVQEGIRGREDELEGYISSIRELKRKYKDRLCIMLGFEAEYIKEFVPYYRRLLQDRGFDYLVLGQHCHLKDGRMTFYEKDELEQYADDVVSGIRSGLYAFVAHPDWYMSLSDHFGPLEEKIAQRICQAAKEKDIPLELNMVPHRLKREHLLDGQRVFLYPCLPFWHVASKYGCKVVIGIDAHRPEDLVRADFAPFLKIVRECDLSLLAHYDPVRKKFTQEGS